MYQLLCSYKSRSKIGNRLSIEFDEIEGEYIDNIRAQYHLKAMKNEQDFREGMLKTLATDMMKTFKTTISNMTKEFDNFKKDCKKKIKDNNDRISNKFSSAKERIRSTENKLRDIIKKSKNEYRDKFNDLSK